MTGTATSGERAAELRLRLLRIYYWATPVFFLADAVWGVSVRAAFLPHPAQRMAYYGFCIACAYACQTAPRLAPIIGMGESAVNVFLLILGVMLPIWTLPDTVAGGATGVSLMTSGQLINVMICGSMLVLSFQRSQERAAAEFGWPGVVRRRS